MILWLYGKYEYSDTTKALLLNLLRAQGIVSTGILFNSLHKKSPGLEHFNPRAKKLDKRLPSPNAVKFAREALKADIGALQPKVIVINDEATLMAVTNQPYSLNQVRGSVYYFDGIPCLVVDKINNLFALNHGRFEFGLYFSKLLRYANGVQRTYPAFDWRLCKTLDDVRECVRMSEQGTLIAGDTETASQFITVTSYTFDVGDKLITYTIPFFDPFKENGCYWDDENIEIAVRAELAKLHKNPIPKALQNGMYDNAYFIEAGWEWNNYIVDTQYIMHSLWAESPKALHEISSYFLDNYVYWKDEAKGIKEDNVGQTHADVERYWQYNGRDTYWTWLSARELVYRVVRMPWALKNYSERLALAAGPCLAASLRGIKVSPERHAQIMDQKRKEAEAGVRDLRELTGEEDFNPYSPHDVAWWLYDVLGAQTTRLQRKPGEKATGKSKKKYGPRSTDEKVLKLIKEQRGAIVNNFIDRLLRAKKPAGVLSKYGNYYKLTRNGRFLSWLNPTGTETSRFNSGSSQFWTGTNGQNIPKPLREFFVADPNYVFVDIDYAASDDRFVAYESEDPEKINTVEGDKDSHCLHCSIFFSKPYELIEQGWKDEEDWVTAEPQGIRQITKKITHGRNYLEGPGTMYNLMGRDAVVATAIALGHKDAAGWIDKELIGICADLSEKYDNPRTGLYKRIQPWQKEICDLAAKNDNLATTAFGFTRKFFGAMANPKTQRELASFYGQGDTAGNINRSLRYSFYGRQDKHTVSNSNESETYQEFKAIDDGFAMLFLLQVHDSLLLAVHKDHLHRIADLKRLMEEKVCIHGRLMRVPAQPKVGLTWSKNMLDWKPELTYEDIVKFEQEGKGKFKGFDVKYPKKSLEQIASEIEIDLNMPDFDLDDDIPGFGQELRDNQPDEPESVLA